MKPKHLFLGYALFLALYILLFLAFRYVIDPDATSYVSMAEQLAAGHGWNSVSGTWSPLNSWLITPFVKAGMDGILAAKYLNCVFGLIAVFLFFQLIRKLNFPRLTAQSVFFTAVLLTVKFAYARLFADLPVLLFLLAYLNIVLTDQFVVSKKSLVLAALIGGAGFYAKSYLFYFSFAHIVWVTAFCTGKGHRFFSFEWMRPQCITNWLRKLALPLLILVLLCLPWVMLLSVKYGHFVPGQQNISGTLNMAMGKQPDMFTEPPFPGAYSYLDDMSSSHTPPVPPFGSLRLFWTQVKITGYNLLAWIRNLNQISLACIAILLVSFFLLVSDKIQLQRKTQLAKLISLVLIWSGGLLLFHIELRYLMIVSMTALLLLGIIAEALYVYLPRFKAVLTTGLMLVLASFLVYPIRSMYAQKQTGQEFFNIAAVLKQHQFTGNYLYESRTDAEFSASIIINFLAKNRHYGPFDRNYTGQDILAAVPRYHIDYFLFYYRNEPERQAFLHGPMAASAKEIYADLYPGIVLLRFKE